MATKTRNWFLLGGPPFASWVLEMVTVTLPAIEMEPDVRGFLVLTKVFLLPRGSHSIDLVGLQATWF